MKPKIQIDPKGIAAFCRRNRIRKLALFGSVLRGDFGPESDVDVLVEFQRDARVGFFELSDMEEEFSRLTGGRKVEINTPASLSQFFRENVLSEAELQYVES